MPTNKPQPKKVLGPAPDFTDEQLDELSQISPADIQAAVTLWNEESNLKGLLEAKPEEDDNGQNTNR